MKKINLTIWSSVCLSVCLFIIQSCNKYENDVVGMENSQTKQTATLFNDIEADSVLSEYLLFDSLYSIHLSLEGALEIGVSADQFYAKTRHLKRVNASLSEAYEKGVPVIFFDDQLAKSERRLIDPEFHAIVMLTPTSSVQYAVFQSSSSYAKVLVNSYPSPCSFRADNQMLTAYSNSIFPIYNYSSQPDAMGVYSWSVLFQALDYLKDGYWIKFTILDSNV